MLRGQRSELRPTDGRGGLPAVLIHQPINCRAAHPGAEVRADTRVAVHSRIVQPVLDVALLFLGLPIVVTRQSRNVFLAIGLCLAVVTLFFLVVLGFQYLGTSALISPAFAAWAPLLIFVPIAVGMSQGMRE